MADHQACSESGGIRGASPPWRGWVSLAITTFLYLEWYRARQLASAKLPAADKAWWAPQRTHGLCQAIRLASERSELEFIAKRLETPSRNPTA